MISQDPAANTKVAPRTAVTLVISEAEVAATIPNVVSLLFDQAKAELESKGLRAVKKEPPRAVRDFQGGQVISQSPVALRSVPLGTMVELEIAADLPYGPDTCIQGYVWREARPEDHVCVTGNIRAQAAFDNSQAAVRRVLQ